MSLDVPLDALRASMPSAIRVRHGRILGIPLSILYRLHCRSVSVGNGPVGALNPLMVL